MIAPGKSSFKRLFVRLSLAAKPSISKTSLQANKKEHQKMSRNARVVEPMGPALDLLKSNSYIKKQSTRPPPPIVQQPLPVAISMEDIKPSRPNGSRIKRPTSVIQSEANSTVSNSCSTRQQTASKYTSSPAERVHKPNEINSQNSNARIPKPVEQALQTPQNTQYTPSPSTKSSTTSPEINDNSSWKRFSNQETSINTQQTDASHYTMQSQFISPVRQRNRDHTMDSVGIVKIAPAEGKFDDIKSEAVNFWGEGFDLTLDTNTKGKKKGNWLSQNDSFLKEATPKETTTKETPFWQKQAQQYWQTTSTPNQNVNTYAEAANNTPSWALEEVNPTQVESSYIYHYPQAWVASQHRPEPMMMVPPQHYMPMQPSLYPQQSKYDIDLFYLLYKAIKNYNTHTILINVQRKLNSILQRHLHEVIPRTFGMLLEVLVILLNYESSRKEMETARRIHESWQFFSYYLTRHLQFSARSPEDLLTILSLSTGLQSYSQNIQNELPIADMVRLYETVKEYCAPDLHKECVHHLRLLKAMPEDKDSVWRDLDERLPSVPTAESIVTEVVNNINVLKSYEAKKEIHITNKIHNPWPNVDLLNYSLVHFMMLRDEFSTPIQNTIKSLFSEKSTNDFELPIGCSVFESTVPRGVTLLLSSSEPAIVFELGPMLVHEKIMESFEEGSLVLLLPESATTINPADHYTTMMNMAKGAMMGYAIRASSHTKGNEIHRLASIHINKQDLDRLNWSSGYTIITCSNNAASALSVLKWLNKQYMNLKRETFSQVLTPRILAANNILSNTQLTAWDEENTESALLTNQDAVPDYLANAEIDISCVVAVRGNQFKAKPGEDYWPTHTSQWNNVAISKRPPLYSISSSQIAAVRYAMCHRIAVIAGAPGTGKTFIAGKLAQLMTEALTVGQFHQPILILTKSQSALDSILTSIVGSISDIVRFGPQPWDAVLERKQATKLAAPNASDSNYRQHQQLERQLCKNQIKLNALMFARFQASQHDPEVLCTVIPPAYLKYLQEGFVKSNSHNFTPNSISIWNVWAEQDEKTKNYPKALEEFKAIDHAQWNLESNYLKRAGRGLMPMVDPNLVQTRFTWVANNATNVLPVIDCTNWPFENSTCSGNSLRTALLNAWKCIPPEKIWSTSKEERSKIIDSLSKLLVQCLESEIQQVLQDQAKVAKEFDDNLAQKWSYLCRFNRVIGMTSDFAATHRDWVSTLWPRAVIVDEASEILESTLTSIILGPRTEHIVLLGNNNVKPKPILVNQELSGNPRNLDVSLFERWKGSGSKFMLLEEQWRMHSGVADIVDKFNSTERDDSSLLVTAPIATCNENLFDGSSPQLEKLYGITDRAYYINYQAEKNSIKCKRYSRLLKIELTEAEVNEARYVAFFAVYLSQQSYPEAKITVLTTCLTQKYLIRHILRDEVPKQTCFVSNVSKIILDTIEQNHGREDGFTIISTATPSCAFSSFDNVTLALTRGKYGVFVIGKPEVDDVHPRWKAFANYMKERNLFGDKLRLTCHAHGDTFTVGHYTDFAQVKNGGCSTPCHTLMSDGHVCQETCHFLSHDEIVCQESCNRLRPTLCTHTCSKKCFECSKKGACPPCEEEITITLSCSHTFTDICHKAQNKDSIQCRSPVTIKMPCGHELSTQCYIAKDVKKLHCDVETEAKLECEHITTTKCGVDPVCTEICSKSYECGHKCLEMCGMFHSHVRTQCTASCPKQLICGHGCDNGCSNPDRHTEFCMEKCNYVCSHGYKCSRECWKDCIKCVSECPYKCNHYKCTKKCYQICDRPPCNQPCKLNLSCSHRCSGLCGEPCPPCSICQGDLKCSISLRTLSEFEPNEKSYVLPECGCVFSVESLDMYFENQAKNGEHTAVKLWGCPTCQKTIYRAYRYNKYIKTEIALVNTIKMQLEKERQKLTRHEKTQIINAMNDETKHSIHNMVGGRWFVCQNQHPYFVGDCGGATQISKCPECNAPIGGTQHKVVESNRFYGEFDGSDKPAWPGQPGKEK